MTDFRKRFAAILRNIKVRLSHLSYRTGIMLLVCCALCYIISFAQMALPISIGMKSGVWVLFFGLAKATQYSGLAVIGAKGLKSLIARRRR